MVLKTPRPILKWVGGKRQLLPQIMQRIPKGVLKNLENGTKRYYEPFVGGGALYFELKPKKSTLLDYNAELINLYQIIQTEPENLIKELKSGTYYYDKEQYYKWWRNSFLTFYYKYLT